MGKTEAVTQEERLKRRYEGTELTRVYLLHLLWRMRGRQWDTGSERKRERRRQGVEETAEKAKWCLCGVRKPCVPRLLIGRWSWGGLRATDQRDLQGFAPSSVEAVCQPLPLQILLPLPGAPYQCSYMTDYRLWKPPPRPLHCKQLLL